MMLEVYDKSRKKLAILQNAFGIEQTDKLNAMSFFSFSLPANDTKIQHCQPFHIIKWKNQLYRIAEIRYEKSDSGSMTYTCEHIIATLMDNVLFGHHVVGNIGIYTADVIRYVLEHQTTRNWVLDQCDFARQFEYGWEQENLLAALFSIPNRFTESYMWKFRTDVYPWRVSLIKLDENKIPEFYIRARKNMLSIAKQSDLRNVCTRLYPLGAGEGVNQLGIRDVNGKIPYLQSPQSYLDKYGLIERVWVDRRYENAESLKASAQAMLDELQEPYIEYQVGVAELRGGDLDIPEVGKVVELIDTDSADRYKTFITEVRGDPEASSCTVNIANRPQDIASTVADLADRQRIEMTYSQGATQVYAQSLQINADSSGGAIMDFFIPQDMRFVNKVNVKIRMGAFRAYSKATRGGGATSTTSGSSSSSSTSSGGGGSTTSGSSSTSTTSSGGDFTTTDYTGDSSATSQTNTADVSKTPSSHRHGYTVHLLKHAHQTRAHSHGMSHTHRVSIDSHSHGISHTHTLSIPDHTHEITAGIYRFGGANAFSLYINGNSKGTWDSSSTELDVTSMMLGNDGKLSRGSWQSLEVRPNSPAFISIVMTIQGFVQSRGDMTV